MKIKNLISFILWKFYFQGARKLFLEVVGEKIIYKKKQWNKNKKMYIQSVSCIKKIF